MILALRKVKNSKSLALLRDQGGYLLVVVTIIGLILGILFGVILPRLHRGQQTRAINNLSEYRAYEAARKGIHAVQLGLKDLSNFQDLTGYAISGATPDNTFVINGNYASLFPCGASLQVYYSPGNDGEYTVTGATDFQSGATTEITVEQVFTDNSAEGLLCRNRGVFWAINRLCGASASSTRHDEYRNEDGNVQFVSGCKGIDLDGHEDGKIDVFVIVSRNGIIHNTSDGDPGNDGWFFHNTNRGMSWVSVDRWPWETPDVDFFRYSEGDVHYYDFDMLETLDGSNVKTNADLKCQRTAEGRWSLSIGNDGSFRGKDPAGTTELWTLERDFALGRTPFQGQDNDGDGVVDIDDRVEVFVIVRSCGITAAPGDTYVTDKTDLKLVSQANPHLPDPMRQVLEAGFFLEYDQ